MRISSRRQPNEKEGGARCSATARMPVGPTRAADERRSDDALPGPSLGSRIDPCIRASGNHMPDRSSSNFAVHTPDSPKTTTTTTDDDASNT